MCLHQAPARERAGLRCILRCFADTERVVGLKQFLNTVYIDRGLRSHLEIGFRLGSGLLL